MSDLHLLIPKAPVLAAAMVAIATTIGASATYHDTITLGSIITAALVVVVGGIFTLRNNLKTFWKDLAEERGEQVKVLEAHLKEKADELVAAELSHGELMSAFAEEQRELRHGLKDQLATANAQLEVERAKHDISGVFVRIESLETRLNERTPMFERMQELLEEIRDLLQVQTPAREES